MSFDPNVAKDRRGGGVWARIPVTPRAIVVGVVVGMTAANVWPLLLVKVGMPLAACVEAIFLVAYMWWAGGGGPPRSLKAVRADSFRVRTLSATEWKWGLAAAVLFAVTVHAAIVVLFRLVPFPAQAFHVGYDFSSVPGVPLRWFAVVVSAASAGICEETGFRGYMQRPIEKRYGALIAIMISALFFMLIHLTKAWSVVGMVPIVFGAGVMLGTLAWASKSLYFCMIGHTIMDVGLFGFYWGQISGTFTQRPISETGMDQTFFLECGVLAAALLLTVVAIVGLRRLSRDSQTRVRNGSTIRAQP
jgi:membrane protease YdiL (CAAX protease family)